MYIYAATTPIDLVEGLTPFPHWIAKRDDIQAAYALRAFLALADAAEHVGWRGDIARAPILLGAFSSIASRIRPVVRA